MKWEDKPGSRKNCRVYPLMLFRADGVPKRIETSCPHSNLYSICHSGTIHNSLKVEPTLKPTHWGMQQQSMRYLHSGVFGLYKEIRCWYWQVLQEGRSLKTLCWVKPVTQDPIMCDSIIWNVCNRQISRDMKESSRCQGEASRGNVWGAVNCWWLWDFFLGRWNVLELDNGDGCTTLWIY